MSCEFCRANLDTYADDCCSPAELTAIEEHLRTCPACATEALARIQTRRTTRAAALRFAPTPEFRLKIEKSIRRNSRPPWAVLRGSAWLPAMAAAAFALTLIVVSFIAWTRHAARQEAMAEFLDLHVATLASTNPVDVVSTDRHTVKPWFQGKLPFTFNLPELQNSEFKLLGGKLIYFKNSPGAQLLFEIRKHQISVFIFQQQAGEFLPGAFSTVSRENGFSIESWSTSGLRYVLISDTSPTDLHTLSEMLRKSAK